MSSIKKLEKIKRLEKVYYSPKGYWRGFSAIKRLSAAAKVSEEEAKSWLKKTSNMANLSSRSKLYSTSNF